MPRWTSPRRTDAAIRRLLGRRPDLRDKLVGSPPAGAPHEIAIAAAVLQIIRPFHFGSDDPVDVGAAKRMQERATRAAVLQAALAARAEFERTGDWPSSIQQLGDEFRESLGSLPDASADGDPRAMDYEELLSPGFQSARGPINIDRRALVLEDLQDWLGIARVRTPETWTIRFEGPEPNFGEPITGIIELVFTGELSDNRSALRTVQRMAEFQAMRRWRSFVHEDWHWDASTAGPTAEDIMSQLIQNLEDGVDGHLGWSDMRQRWTATVRLRLPDAPLAVHAPGPITVWPEAR